MMRAHTECCGQLLLPMFDGAEASAGGEAQSRCMAAPSVDAGGDDGVVLTGRAVTRPRKRTARAMPTPGEPLDPIDVLLRDFARALIATAIAVHDDMRNSGLATAPKSQSPQGKSRDRRVAVGRPDVVSSAPHNDSGAAPFAPAGPVVPNHLRRLET